jgi:hypothetical protein
MVVAGVEAGVKFFLCEKPIHPTFNSTKLTVKTYARRGVRATLFTGHTDSREGYNRLIGEDVI